jgi:hypothetical protein
MVLGHINRISIIFSKNLKSKAFLILAFLAMANAISYKLVAQDISQNIISQVGGVNDGDWSVNQTGCTILLTVANNGPIDLAPYKIRPSLSIPTDGSATIAPNAQQTGLPTGWTILSNNGTSLRLSNGTDIISDGEVRNIQIVFLPLALTTLPRTLNINLFTTDGVAPGNNPGVLAFNDISNDPGVTSYQVVAILPLRLTAFTATKSNCSAALAWKTAEELNTKSFEVQSSADGIGFATVATVAANGSGSGSYSVTVPQRSASTYYRLKMMGKDGAYTYSAIKHLKLGNCAGKEWISLAPNPVIRGINATLSITTAYSGRATVKITNAQGQRVAAQSVVLAAGASNLPISTQRLAGGVYYITLLGDGGVAIGSPVKMIS